MNILEKEISEITDILKKFDYKTKINARAPVEIHQQKGKNNNNKILIIRQEKKIAINITQYALKTPVLYTCILNDQKLISTEICSRLTKKRLAGVIPNICWRGGG